MFEIGDRVRMICDNPAHGAGSVGVGDIGVVVGITDNLYYVDFPQHKGWAGVWYEFEDEFPAPKALVVGSKPTKKIKLDEVLNSKLSTPIKLWCMYDTHSGYKHNWFTRETCYSTICKDNTKTLCKFRPDSMPTELEFDRMVGIINKVSKVVKECNKKHKPNYKQSKMMFNSGSGYADYFAFVLYRLFYRDRKVFNTIVYLHQTHKYTLAESYILTGLFHWGHHNWKITNNTFVSKGSAKKLSNVGRCRNHGNYSMRPYLCGSIASWEVDGNANALKVSFGKVTKEKLEDRAKFDEVLAFINGEN